MSCKYCEGSEEGWNEIMIAPAAFFAGIPKQKLKYTHCCEELIGTEWFKEKVEQRLFLFGCCDFFHVFYYCPNCGEKLDYMKWVMDLWQEFGDVPMNPKTERIETKWLWFDKDTNREDIWHWFEETFCISVAEDLMGMEVEYK